MALRKVDARAVHIVIKSTLDPAWPYCGNIHTSRSLSHRSTMVSSGITQHTAIKITEVLNQHASLVLLESTITEVLDQAAAFSPKP